MHVDHHAPTVEFLNNQNLDAMVEDVTSYDPDESFEMIILSHLPTIKRAADPGESHREWPCDLQNRRKS